MGKKHLEDLKMRNEKVLDGVEIWRMKIIKNAVDKFYLG
jgi:hypothetical protein